MNIIALVVASVGFGCALIAAFATQLAAWRNPPKPLWSGWLALAIALFVAAFILQFVFAPHGLVQYGS